MTSIPKIDRFIRSKRNSIALLVERDSTLTVKAPIYASEKLINDFIFEKRNWILKKQDIAKEKYKHFVPKKFVEGENFLFLGENYELEYIDSLHSPILLDKKLFIIERHRNVTEKLILFWYKQQALKIITERLKFYSQLSGIQYNSFKITSARKRWGSCSRTGKLNFSFRLIMAPIEVVNYVIIHELAHIIEHNHSRNFRKLVSQYDSDFKTHLTWLKKHNYIAFVI